MNPGRGQRAISCATGCWRRIMAGPSHNKPWDNSGLEARGMPAQMVVHEGGDEVIAVIVTALAAQGERNVRFLAGSLQQLRAKLFGQERIGVAIVHQQIGKSGSVLDQRDRIMPAPGLLV